MNNEVRRKWTLPPRADDNAIGAALRRAVAIGRPPVPEELGSLLDRLERRNPEPGDQAAMS